MRRLLSELASGLDEYRRLARESAEACDELVSDLPADWEERARRERTVAGYRPNLAHGVEVNIEPLAAAKVVPNTVEGTCANRSALGTPAG